MAETAFAMRDFWPLYWRIKNAGQWQSRKFDHHKAYLLCMLAELAYAHLGQHEVDQWKRMKHFPCTTLELAVAAGPGQISAATFAGLAGERIEVRVYIVETRNFISIAIRIEEVILIASRGTADSYDRRIDADFALDQPLMSRDNLRMHRGYLGEALKHAYLIANKIALDKDKERPAIYACGHSLGGALAAILLALYGEAGPWPFHYWGRFRDARSWTPLLHISALFYVNSSYTIGTPRYGNHTAVKQLPNPYSIIRASDPIIYLPLQRQSYADGLREYGTNLEPAARRNDGLMTHAGRSLGNIVRRAGWMAEHNATLYREEMARAIGIKFHPMLLPEELRSKRIT